MQNMYLVTGTLGFRIVILAGSEELALYRAITLFDDHEAAFGEDVVVKDFKVTKLPCEIDLDKIAKIADLNV